MAPPAIPKNAPKQAVDGSESPWDDDPYTTRTAASSHDSVPNAEGSPWEEPEVISSAPAPTTPEKAEAVQGLLPNWLGRPIVHADHAQQLETDAAINEYGLKMPRAQAEDQAHKEYVGKQREEAASHHLSGMKVANATGDIEAARKHHMMYSLHAKALGFEPVGAVPASITDKHVYKLKFKPHKGDMFAAGEDAAPAKAQEPDAIMGGYKGPKLAASTKTAPAQSMKNATPLHSGKTLNEHLMGKAESFKAHRGDVFAIIYRQVEKAPKELTKNQREALYLLHVAGARLLAKAQGGSDSAAEAPDTKDEASSVKKLASTPKKPRPCICLAYSHPHRVGGGSCQARAEQKK